MENIISHWLVDSVHYFKVESRKVLLNILVLNHNSGYDNRTRQTGQVIRDLYSPDSFYTRLGERAIDNFQPCINTVCSLVNSEAERVYFFQFHLIIGNKTKRDVALFKTPKSNS